MYLLDTLEGWQWRKWRWAATTTQPGGRTWPTQHGVQTAKTRAGSGWAATVTGLLGSFKQWNFHWGCCSDSRQTACELYFKNLFWRLGSHGCRFKKNRGEVGCHKFGPDTENLAYKAGLHDPWLIQKVQKENSAVLSIIFVHIAGHNIVLYLYLLHHSHLSFLANLHHGFLVCMFHQLWRVARHWPFCRSVLEQNRQVAEA